LLLALVVTVASGQTPFSERLADSAVTLTKQNVRYDASYFQLKYPNGDVPADVGVCTDVIVRAYRKLGIDLQRLVHEDMKNNFKLYPRHWRLPAPDKNIDHRRVPNLMTFFGRKGTVHKLSDSPRDYQPGDIVCWNLGGGITHIGLVTRVKATGGQRYLMLHNIGNGQVTEDCLFSYKIIGHYRFAG
jgi:uncharacterized protein